jgi:hypothetical protein
MSYLQLPNGIPNFSKAVISFWFICPKENLGREGPTDLLVFGERPTATYVTSQAVGDATMTVRFCAIDIHCAVSDDVSIQEFLGTNTALRIDDGSTIKRPPCFITIEDNGEKFYLRVNLQMSNAGTGVGYGPFTGTTQATGALGTANFNGCGTTETDDCGNKASYLEKLTQTFSITDNTAVTLSHAPDYFDIGGTSVGLNGSRSCEIEPDVWHHVLLSFDLTGTINATGSFTTISATQGAGSRCYIGKTDSASISSSCKVWMAIDDENLFGQSLVPIAYPERNLGPNDLISINAHNIASTEGLAALTQRNFTPMYNGTLDRSGFGYWVTEYPSKPRPSYRYEPGVIKTQGHPIGVPSTESWGINEVPVSVQHCEMAELQIFTGITLDTSDEKKRRMFLAPKEEGGVALYPVNPQDTAELLKRQPTILLHGAGNWQKGKNTGTSGMDNDGELIKEGQFVPTGEIKKYKPDPSIKSPPSSPAGLRAYGPPRIIPRRTPVDIAATMTTTAPKKGLRPQPLPEQPQWTPNEGLLFGRRKSTLGPPL